MHFLQSFVNVRDLVGFSVIVQAYWRLKVDGNHSIFRGDIAPPDGRLYHLLDKSSRWIMALYLIYDSNYLIRYLT